MIDEVPEEVSHKGSKDVPKAGEFQEGKVWFARRGSLIQFGVTSSVIDELGEVESVEFSDEGETVAKGDHLVTVEGTRGKFEFLAPTDGNIEAINETAKEEPGIVSEDPLEEGWLVKVQVDDLSDFRDSLIDSHE